MAKRKKKSGSFERFNNARAEKFEIENRKTRRHLIPREEIEEEWIRIISQIKYGFQSLPSRMARSLAGIDDPGEIYEIVERDVNRIFDSLADLGIQLESEADLLEEENDEEGEEEEEPIAELKAEESPEETPAPAKKKKTKKGPPRLREEDEPTDD